eukprot:Gb_15720 [translate_table: standard]
MSTSEHYMPLLVAFSLRQLNHQAPVLLKFGPEQCCFIAAYFTVQASGIIVGKQANMLSGKNSLLLQPSRLLLLAASFCHQLDTDLLDDCVADSVVHNLVYVTGALHSFAKSKVALRAEDVQVCLISIFSALWNAVTESMQKPSSGGIKLFPPKLARVEFQRMQQRCYRGICRERDVKVLADEVLSHMKDIMGVENFVQAYNSVRQKLKAKRDKRKQVEKIAALVNPVRHAQRKIKLSGKRQAQKKRLPLIQSSMGAWGREDARDGSTSPIWVPKKFGRAGT